MTKSIVNNFVGGSRKSDMSLLSQDYTQNLDFEEFGEGAASRTVLRSIPGLTTVLGITGIPRGRFVASRGHDGRPRLFVVFGQNLYAIDRIDGEWTAVEVGVVGGSGPVTMCETGGYGHDIDGEAFSGAHPQLCIADGTTLHVCATDANPSEIAATYRNIVLPTGVDGERIQPTHVTYQYGYLTVNDTKSDFFYRSYLQPFELIVDGHVHFDVFTEDPTVGETYPAGMYIASDWCPDNTTAMISTGGVLFTMGPRSFQRFFATDDTERPFNSPNTSSMNIGILAPWSLASIGDNIFFLGSSDVGQFGIYRANGSECVRISVPEMERVISKFTNPGDAIGFTYTRNSHVFYCITFREDDRTYCFDVASGIWTNRVSTSPSDNTDHKWRYGFAVLFDNRICFLTDNAIVAEDYDHFTEHDGRPIVRLRRGGATINGLTPFYVDNVVFMLSNGYGNRTSPEVNPRVMFRYSLNGSTFSNERIGTMGRQGDYNYMTVFPRLGRGCVLNMELSCSEDIDFAILKCAINATGNGRGF